MLVLARVYDATPPGLPRVLVTRHWPRGVRKTAVDRWYKELGLPPELLTPWVSGQLTAAEAERAYRADLAQAPAATALQGLARLALTQDICLLRTIKDDSRTHLPWLVAELAPVAAALIADDAQATRVLEMLASLGHQFGQVTLYRRQGEQLRPVAHASALAAAPHVLAVRERPAPPAASDLALWAMQEGRTVAAANPEAEGRTMTCFAGAYAELVVPALALGQVVGVLVVEREGPEPFAPAVRELAERVAAGCAARLGS